MKKLSILLLVLALAGGMAFAADVTFSGNVTFSVSWDLDGSIGGIDGDTGIANLDVTDFDLVLAAGSSKSASGSGDLYAVASAKVSGLTIDETGGGGIVAPAITLESFKVVSGDITFNLMGATAAMDYAKYGDFDGDGVLDVASAAALGLATTNGGVGVTISDLTLGADFWYDGAAAAYMVFGGYSAEIADGITASLAAGFDGAFDLAAKLAYAADDFSVTAALDAANNFGALDASAIISAVVDVVTVKAHVYWDGGAGIHVNNKNTIALDDVTLGVNFFLNDVKNYAGSAVQAKVTLPLDALTLTVDGTFDLDDSSIGAGVLAEYALDDASKVWVDVDTTNTFGSLTAKVGASSTGMIDGATTKLEWVSGDLLAAGLGKITGSVAVAL